MQDAEVENDAMVENCNENRQPTSLSTIYKQVKHKKNKITTPKILTGTPYIVYSLQDYEILEDLSIIKMNDDLNRC